MDKTYKLEIKKIFKSIVLNSPNLYKDVDFASLTNDWISFFKKNGLPPERVFECYEDAVAFKAQNNNFFGSISQVDILGAWNRVKSSEASIKSHIKCDICRGTGTYKVYSFTQNDDIEVSCPRQH